MLAEATKVHPQDQKLIFKNKERDSKSYLDRVKVKDGSKMVVVEDIESRQRRTLESLKIEKKDKTSKFLSEIKLEVDELAKKVAALEACAFKGGIIAEMDVDNLTENLMRKLDEIVGEVDVKLQRFLKVGRVQRQIETLDKLWKCPGKKQQQPSKHCESVAVTTKWETFD